MKEEEDERRREEAGSSFMTGGEHTCFWIEAHFVVVDIGLDIALHEPHDLPDLPLLSPPRKRFQIRRRGMHTGVFAVKLGDGQAIVDGVVGEHSSGLNREAQHSGSTRPCPTQLYLSGGRRTWPQARH